MSMYRIRAQHKHVVEEIGKRIALGVFAVGATLPSEAQLREMLRVSRTALREALRVLAAKGLLEPKSAIGPLVRPSAHWNYLDSQVLSWMLQGSESDQIIDELYELRHLIEPIAAALAAKYAKEQQVETLREAYAEMEMVGDDGAKLVEPDVKFHRAIIRASGNEYFASLAHAVSGVLAVNFELLRETPHGHRHSMPLHKEVLDAIENHDASAARIAMQKLIENSWRDARNTRGAKRACSAGALSRQATRSIRL